MDLAVRARPNRGTVESLFHTGALDSLLPMVKTRNDDNFMEQWDAIIDQRNAAEKQAARDAKMRYKNVSMFGSDVTPAPAPKRKEEQPQKRAGRPRIKFNPSTDFADDMSEE